MRFHVQSSGPGELAITHKDQPIGLIDADALVAEINDGDPTILLEWIEDELNAAGFAPVNSELERLSERAIALVS